MKGEKSLGVIPFKFKRVYLRAIFQIYISGENNFQTFHLIDIITILEIGMNELKKYPVFLEGIL